MVASNTWDLWVPFPTPRTTDLALVASSDGAPVQPGHCSFYLLSLCHYIWHSACSLLPSSLLSHLFMMDPPTLLLSSVRMKLESSEVCMWLTSGCVPEQGIFHLHSPSPATPTFTLVLSSDPMGFGDSGSQMPNPRGWRGLYPQYTSQCAASSQSRKPQQKQARESLSSVAFLGPRWGWKSEEPWGTASGGGESLHFFRTWSLLPFLSPLLPSLSLYPRFLFSHLSSSGFGILLQNPSPSAYLCVWHLTRVMYDYSSWIYFWKLIKRIELEGNLYFIFF